MFFDQDEFIHLANRSRYIVSPIEQSMYGSEKITVVHEIEGKDKFCMAMIMLPTEANELIKVSCGIFKDEGFHIASREKYADLPSVMRSIERQFEILEAQVAKSKQAFH